MADTKLSIVIQAKDEASKVLKGLHSHLQDAAKYSQTAAIGLGGAAVAIGAFAKQALSAAADFEQSKVAFETMLGSADSAQKMLNDLTDFAKKTPFELKGLETTTKQLLAYGFKQEEILPDLKALGDIAAGVGMDKLPNLTLAFGQVKAATKLTGNELRQFTEAGVPLLDELAKQFQKPVAEIQEMVSAGEIGFPAVEQALKSLTGEGGRFNNLMGKQSETLSGMISNLKDVWAIFLREQGQQLIEWAKTLTEKLIYFTQNVLPVLMDKISALTTWFGEHKIALAAVAGAVVGLLIPSIYSAAVAFGTLTIALAPYLLAGAVIGGLIYAIWQLVKNWDVVVAKLSEVWDWMLDKIKTVFNSIVAFLKTAWDAITWPFRQQINFIVGLFDWFMSKLGTDAVTYMSALKETFISIWDAIKNFFVGVWDAMSAKVSAVWAVIKKVVDFIFPHIQSVFTAGKDALLSVWQAVWQPIEDYVGGVWDRIKDKISSVVDWISDKIQWVSNQFSSIGGGIGNFVGDLTSRGGEITKLAAGGIVRRPTYALVGENGPEAVIPLNRIGGVGGVVNNFNLYINGEILDEDTAVRIGDKIISRLKSNLRL